MAPHILIWMKQRWRLLFIILVPLVLLPLPIVNKTSVCFLFLCELIITNFLLASKMWLYCHYTYYLLGFRSHAITSDIIITNYIFSDGKQNSFFPWINFENTFVVYIQAGVLEPEEVAQSYFKDIIALFFGSLAIAYAVESVNLHRRIALFVLSLVGTSTKWYFFHSSNVKTGFPIGLKSGRG